MMVTLLLVLGLGNALLLWACLRLRVRVQALEAALKIDGLSGVLNRNAALVCIEAQRMRVQQGSTDVWSLAFLDMDSLKDINDQGGHAAGDAAIRQLASTLCRECPADWALGRYGGDEFIVLAPVQAEVLEQGLQHVLVKLPTRLSFTAKAARLQGGMAVAEQLNRLSLAVLEHKTKQHGEQQGTPVHV